MLLFRKNEGCNYTQGEIDILRAQLEEEKRKNKVLLSELAVTKAALLDISDDINSVTGNSEEYLFKKACDNFARILCERYRYQVSGGNFEEGEHYLLSNLSCRDFEVYIKNTVEQCLNLYRLLDIADEINGYCARFKELKRLHLIHAVQTLIQNTGGVVLPPLQQKLEDRYVILCTEQIKSEKKLTNSGFDFKRYKNRQRLSECKTKRIAPQQQGESTRSFFQRLFAHASSCKQAIRLYIDYSEEEKLLLYDRIRELRNQLITLGLATQTLTSNELFDRVGSEMEKSKSR